MNDFIDSTAAYAKLDHENTCEHADIEATEVLDAGSPLASMSQKVCMTIAVILPFVGCISAVVLLWQFGWMGWPYLLMLIAGWGLTTLGITVGFHRLLTHKSFETYRWIRAVWMMLGALSVQGEPLTWCAVHRRHHGHSDQEGDPHSPNLAGTGIWATLKGLWHGQVGWLFSGYWSHPDFEKYVPDLTTDRLLVWVNKNYFLFVFLSLAVPAAIGFFFELWLGEDHEVFSSEPSLAFFGAAWFGFAGRIM